MIIAALGRQPFGTVPEIVLSILGCDEIVNAVAGRRDIGGVRVHFTVLVEWSLDVSTIETAHSISTNERSSDILCLINSVICAKYINIKTSLPVYEVVVEFQHTELGVLIDKEPDVMRQVVGHARLARRHFVCIASHNIQLAEPLVADERRCADLGGILDIPVTIDVRYRLAVRRIAKKFHRIGYYCFVGVGVSGTSSR